MTENLEGAGTGARVAKRPEDGSSSTRLSAGSRLFRTIGVRAVVAEIGRLVVATVGVGSGAGAFSSPEPPSAANASAPETVKRGRFRSQFITTSGPQLYLRYLGAVDLNLASSWLVPEVKFRCKPGVYGISGRRLAILVARTSWSKAPE